MKRDVLLGLLASIAESSCDEKSKERMQKQIEELKDDLKERSSVEQREKKLNEDLEEVMKNNNMKGFVCVALSKLEEGVKNGRIFYAFEGLSRCETIGAICLLKGKFD